MINLDNTNIFDMGELVGYVNKTPFVPGKAGEMFVSNGISTTTAILDMRDGAVSLINDVARGGADNAQGAESRGHVAVVTKHFPLSRTIAPSDFQNIRVFGGEELDTLELVRNRYLDDMLKSHAMTLEHQRVEAIKGMITNSASGAIDLYAEFGESQAAVEMELSTATDVRSRILDAIEASEDALGGEISNGYVALCGSNFFRALIENANVKDSYARWMDGAALRDDVRNSFVYGGVEFVAYRGKANGTDFVETDAAYMCPRADIYKTSFAPGNFVETANTVGLPAYAKSELADFGRGITLLTESNPISYVTRPAAVVKLHKELAV